MALEEIEASADVQSTSFARPLAAELPDLARSVSSAVLAPFDQPFEPLLQKEMALVLHSHARARRLAEGSRDETRVGHPLLELCLTSTKGLGLFAKTHISAGTCILSEKPLLVLPAKDCGIYHQLQQELSKLTPRHRDVFHSLSSEKEHLCQTTKRDIDFEVFLTKRPIRDDDHLRMEAKKISTFLSNATSLAPSSGYGIFPLSSRINHDCTPNTYASYNPTLGKQTVYATRDIYAQEELSIAYIGPAQKSEDREGELNELNIDCQCSSCRPSNAQKASDRNRGPIDQAGRGLAVYDGTVSRKELKPEVVPTDPNFALTVAESAINLMRVERLINMSLAKLHRQASKYSLQLGNAEKAKAHARKGSEVEKLCLGTETDYMNDVAVPPLVDEHSNGETRAHGVKANAFGAKNVDAGGGNAAAWMKEIERILEKDSVKIRMCEKRVAKENKKAEKKAAKKKGKK